MQHMYRTNVLAMEQYAMCSLSPPLHMSANKRYLYRTRRPKYDTALISSSLVNTHYCESEAISGRAQGRGYAELDSVLWSELLIASPKSEAISDCARLDAKLLNRTYLRVCLCVCKITRVIYPARTKCDLVCPPSSVYRHIRSHSLPRSLLWRTVVIGLKSIKGENDHISKCWTLMSKGRSRFAGVYCTG